ncbi:endonuclease/exonuclease/phosphatase family protein [Pontibacter harenae]|uniref:endonuclease/exonuclease/phosphatase family protein n=1 Tax=Pontibacter harenae TaxID=2894083 RepID=UPI001E626FEE|nr:endonuclease/exonuclease/phosphatase family protein [Pontibacter harenae]MCC9167252.1 endonuclease/exonuclease/phosphatase family protein [Pontibacter harenae]
MRYGIKTLLILFTLITLAGCARVGLKSNKERIQTIAFYNVERLFDTANDTATDDDVFTPTGYLKWDEQRYQQKVKNLAAVIKSIGGENGPAIIGLCEIENKEVLNDLVHTEALEKSNYAIIHYDMPDEQGLDVAFLYKPKVFSPITNQSISIPFEDKNFKTRGILLVKGKLLGEDVTLYVNHWPPRSRATKGSREDDSRLKEAAATLRKLIEQQQELNPSANIILMGDFDAEPKSEVMENILKASGRPNPVFNEELFNPFYMHFIDGKGSYFNRADFQMIDQIIVSKSLLTGKGLELVRGSATIHRPDFATIRFGRYRNTPRKTYTGTTYLGGYSDHFPVYIQVKTVKK